MTPERLSELEANAARLVGPAGWYCACSPTVADLVAEVRRLQALVAALRRELLETIGDGEEML